MTWPEVFTFTSINSRHNALVFDTHLQPPGVSSVILQ
jgi:hypothetical protein